MPWPLGGHQLPKGPLEQGMALYREAKALPKVRVLYPSDRALKLYAKAAKCFQKALDANGNDARALYGYGAVQFELGMSTPDPFALAQAQTYCAGALRLGLSDDDERSWCEFVVRMAADTLRAITLNCMRGG